MIKEQEMDRTTSKIVMNHRDPRHWRSQRHTNLDLRQLRSQKHNPRDPRQRLSQ